MTRTPEPDTAMSTVLRQRAATQRGFTLIEMLAVVAILGILAAVAVGAYSRQVRNAHRTEVISDLSNLTLRQKTFLSVSGHYASSRTDESDVYPAKATITGAKTEVAWDTTNAAYTGPAAGAYARGGPAVHGFDALRFMPEGATSFCGYATISGHGADAQDAANADVPPAGAISSEVFPQPAASTYYARDWFFSYALCDFDYDGTFWAFTTTHYENDVNSGAIGTTYLENE